MEEPLSNNSSSSSPESKLLLISPIIHNVPPFGCETETETVTNSKKISSSSPSRSQEDCLCDDSSLHEDAVMDEPIMLDFSEPKSMSPEISSEFPINGFKRSSSSSSGSPVAALPSSVPRTASSLLLSSTPRKRKRLEENLIVLSGSGIGSEQNESGSPSLSLSLDRPNGRNPQNGLLTLCRKSLSCGSSPMRLGENREKLGSVDSRTLVIQILRSKETEVGLATAADDSRNVGGKELESHEMDAELSESPDISKTIEVELATAADDSRNVGGKELEFHEMDAELSEIPDNSKTTEVELATTADDSRKVSEISDNSKMTELELAKTPNGFAESVSSQLGSSDFLEKCSDASPGGGSADRNVRQKTESELANDLGSITPGNNDIGQTDSNSGEREVLRTGDKSTEKSESGLSVGKILRSRKILLNGENSRTGQSSIKKRKTSGKKDESVFIGEPFTEEEAMKRWQWRYDLKSKSKRNGGVLNAGEEDEIILNVQFHYAQASVDGCIFNIGDCTLVKGEDNKKHIGRILEFFKTMDGQDYFRVQWFYRADDTVMKEAAATHDKRRVFYSTVENDNPLDCIISKVSITQIPNTASLKQDDIPPSDFYYDMEYCVEYSTFRNLPYGDKLESQSSVPHQINSAIPLANLASCEAVKAELTLLDLFSGCGGMSTGLSFGAKLSNVNLVAKWAVDFQKSATESVKLNHPEAQARNESAADFLELLKRWEKLCQLYAFSDSEKTQEAESINEAESESSEDVDSDSDDDSDAEYEVSHLIDICYGDPNDTGKNDLHFRVSWKGYGPDEDTWESIDGLSNCKGKIVDFVKNGCKSKHLPLPGDVDVICGGPPCQGISGYNRHRNVDSPLTDEKNQQLVVFMDIVEFLKPKYVLMENVTDILRFGGASLGRYALSRIVGMKYQARLGTIAAGCYGLPQFRLRVFLWGAISSEKLPPFPLPTHEVVVKYWPPLEFERNTVAYDEGQKRKLINAAVLSDAISDLPPVTCHEKLDEMPYSMPPVTEFQRYIRRSKEEIMGTSSSQVVATNEPLLYDHRAYPFSEDNRIRVSQVPHRKGANFRDLAGVVVGNDNTARRDPKIPPPVLPSGELLVPDCVFNYENGKSRRPLGRLWWDETVPTILTVPIHFAQTILHPEQDRVLTIRECARLQGFPDYYRFCGTVKERYCQVGNAVAIPVGKALGYALGMAYQKLTDDNPLMTLPPNFAFQLASTDDVVVLGK